MRRGDVKWDNQTHLRSTLECDDWQMSLGVIEVDVQRESIAWLSGNERTRRGAG